MEANKLCRYYYQLMLYSETNAHDVSDVSIKESNKMRSPAYSFGSRHEKKSTASAPAPNSYNTSGLNPRGKDSQNTSVTLILIKPYLIYMDVPFCNRIFFDEVS